MKQFSLWCANSSLTSRADGTRSMVADALQNRPFIELYDLAPEAVECLSSFLVATPPNHLSEPLILPAVSSGITWREYDSFLRAIQSRYLRHSYMNGVLELMSPRLFERENTKAVLRRFVQTLTFERHQAIVTLGATTLASPAKQLGIEPDETFSFVRRLRNIDGLLLNVDEAGPPDLAIEIVGIAHADTEARISAVDLDRPTVLARLGVREIWSVNRGRVQILHSHSGRPVTADYSQLLPSVTGQMLTRHLRNRLKIGENACVRDFVQDALQN
jgi:Uma2 family endonuclease